MKILRTIFEFIGHNKYWIVVALGVVIVGFVDQNSILTHTQYLKIIDDLEKEIAHYNERYDADAEQIKQLNTNPHAITKIAREQYYMKADNEDIFVLSTDLGKNKNLTVEK